MRSQGVPEAVGASEDVIEADEERNELRVEVGPEQGATWIRAAAARDLSANPPSCLRVHVVSEQIADLGSDADVRRHWEGHPDERADPGHDSGLARIHADHDRAAPHPAVGERPTGLIQEDPPHEARQHRAAVLAHLQRLQRSWEPCRRRGSPVEPIELKPEVAQPEGACHTADGPDRRAHVPRLHALSAIDERDILIAAECQASGEPDARLSANWYRPADRKCHWKCQGNHTREGTPSVLALQLFAAFIAALLGVGASGMTVENPGKLTRTKRSRVAYRPPDRITLPDRLVSSTATIAPSLHDASPILHRNAPPVREEVTEGEEPGHARHPWAKLPVAKAEAVPHPAVPPNGQASPMPDSRFYVSGGLPSRSPLRSHRDRGWRARRRGCARTAPCRRTSGILTRSRLSRTAKSGNPTVVTAESVSRQELPDHRPGWRDGVSPWQTVDAEARASAPPL